MILKCSIARVTSSPPSGASADVHMVVPRAKTIIKKAIPIALKTEPFFSGKILLIMSILLLIL
jgi:hypothetical protein